MPYWEAVSDDVLPCAYAKNAFVALEDLTSETFVKADKLNVKQLQDRLKVVVACYESDKRKSKVHLQDKFRASLRKLKARSHSAICSNNLLALI